MRKYKTPSVILAGVFSLAIVMGVGRFAYTALVAGMIAGGLSEADAGIIAALNLAGYLLGALAAGFVKWERSRYIVFSTMLVLSIATTGLMGCTSSVLWWNVIRFLSGFASGVCFVSCTAIVFEYLRTAGRSDLAVLLYSGVGLGIASSGLFAPMLKIHHSVDIAWIGLALACLLPAAFAIFSFGGAGSKHTENKVSDAKRTQEGSYRRLLVSYFLEGFGYIIYATFVVVLIKTTTHSDFASNTSWVVTGCAAAVSVPVWRVISTRMGHLRALIMAFAIQAVSVLIPALTPSLPAVLFSGALFGGTFMGITALSLQYAVMISPASSGKTIAVMTAVYSVGQILGPFIAGVTADKLNGFSFSFILSSICLALAVVALAFRGRLSKQTMQLS